MKFLLRHSSGIVCFNMEEDVLSVWWYAVLGKAFFLDAFCKKKKRGGEDDVSIVLGLGG